MPIHFAVPFGKVVLICREDWSLFLMNRILKILMVSVTLGSTGFGLVQPVLAIFIKDNLVGGTILAAGVASMMFLVTKSAVQLPFSRYVDNQQNRVKWLLAGTVLVTIVPFVYVLRSTSSPSSWLNSSSAWGKD
jgi:hypothetical protein